MSHYVPFHRLFNKMKVLIFWGKNKLLTVTQRDQYVRVVWQYGRMKTLDCEPGLTKKHFFLLQAEYFLLSGTINGKICFNSLIKQIQLVTWNYWGEELETIHKHDHTPQTDRRLMSKERKCKSEKFHMWDLGFGLQPRGDSGALL